MTAFGVELNTIDEPEKSHDLLHTFDSMLCVHSGSLGSIKADHFYIVKIVLAKQRRSAIFFVRPLPLVYIPVCSASLLSISTSSVV